MSWTIFPGLTWSFPERGTWAWFLAALANSISVLETWVAVPEGPLSLESLRDSLCLLGGSGLWAVMGTCHPLHGSDPQ